MRAKGRRYPSAVPAADRLRSRGAWAFAVAGNLAHAASQRLAAHDGRPSLAGDRWVEWSFCFARLADGPGRTLDFGADIGFLSLAAAQRGHDVVALDRVRITPAYCHERVEFRQADILDRPLDGETFDQIVNCSSVEHVGLAGRYDSTDAPDGDLEAMAIMREALAPRGRLVMAIPVGRDLVCPPLHRIYGAERLPRLLDGYTVQEEQYWVKADAWEPTDRETALATEGSASFYSLGLFVLTRS
jgi:SAM-dependent methyltransferase